MKRPVGTVRDFPLGSLIVVERVALEDIVVVVVVLILVCAVGGSRGRVRLKTCRGPIDRKFALWKERAMFAPQSEWRSLVPPASLATTPHLGTYKPTFQFKEGTI